METEVINAEGQKRASRFVRSPSPPRMQLKPRDVAIIQAANDYRILRQDQIQQLFFPSKNTAQVRLQLLWQHEFLKRDFLPVIGTTQNSPLLYSVDTRGAELLRSELGYTEDQLRLSKKVHFDSRFLEHTLGLAETRIAISQSCTAHNYQVKKWADEKAIKADYDHVAIKNKLVAILPDAHCVVGLPNNTDLHFFVEYDTGTEHLKFLAQKLKAYWLYFQNPQCQKRYGTNRIRVLIIVGSNQTTSGQKRVANLLKLIQDLGNVSWFWFATTTAFQNDILKSPAWYRADKDTPQSLIV